MRLFEDNESKEQLVLVIYDISDTKKRLKIVNTLNEYGFRVQKSAFECRLNNIKYEKLCKTINRIASKDDSIRVYKLSGNDLLKSWGNDFNKEEQFIIF